MAVIERDIGAFTVAINYRAIHLRSQQVVSVLVNGRLVKLVPSISYNQPPSHATHQSTLSVKASFSEALFIDWDVMATAQASWSS